MAISSSLLFVVGRWSLAVRDSILLTTNDQRPTTALQILRVLRHLFAALQTHVRFLPIRTVAGELPPPPFFSRIIRGAHRRHLHLEDRLHRFLDLGLRRLGRHLKHQRVLRLFNAEALFRDHRFLNNLIRGFHLRLPPPSCAGAAPVSSSLPPAPLRANVAWPTSSANPATSRAPAAQTPRG